MSEPLSPPAVTESGRPELPAYISNGVMGLRVLDIPLLPGIVMVSGFAGTHPLVGIEAAAEAPYPVAGDIGINTVWLTTTTNLEPGRRRSGSRIEAVAPAGSGWTSPQTGRGRPTSDASTGAGAS